MSQSKGTADGSQFGGLRPRPVIWHRCTLASLPLLVLTLLGLSFGLLYVAAMGCPSSSTSGTGTVAVVAAALAVWVTVTGGTIGSWPSPVLTLVFWPIVIPKVVASALQARWKGAGRSGAKRAMDAMDDLLTLSAVELSRRVVTRELSAEALTRLCIARLDHVNPRLNAVVATRYSEALTEARGEIHCPPVLSREYHSRHMYIHDTFA